jgi:hypothetical protein
MKTRSIRCALALAVLVELAAALTAQAHELRERVPMDWRHDAQRTRGRDGAAPPPPPEPPPQLAISRPAERPDDRRTGHELVAYRAGEGMAHEAAEVWGRRECWRAGFARGVDGALDDPRVGARDHEDGLKSGRSDPRVRALGEHFAKEAADGPAASDAEARVRGQFMDLSREPGRDREGPPPQAPVPAFAGPFASEPALEDVFDAYPFARTPGLSNESRRAVAAWRLPPAAFARGDRMARAYDANWKDPAAAFAIWQERQGRGSPWFLLTGEERGRFRAAFDDGFERMLASIDLAAARDAWRAGFSDGWRYGALVHGEWAYRKGFAEGFDAGVGEAASIVFPYVYARAYDAAYDQRFNEWSRSAHPGIAGVRLSDETGDGIFEPGERVLVESELVNYGGGEGTFELIASGRRLGAPAPVDVRLSGRGPVPGVTRLALRIDDGMPVRTRTAVTVSLADARADAPLYVSRPLEIEGSPSLAADRLGGRVTLTFVVSNASRRDVRAVVRVEPLTGARDPREQDLGLVPSGATGQAAFTFTGIHPLDLIGGTSRWRAVVIRGGTTDDEREVRIDPVATDLSNPDLMDFMVALAKTPGVSRSDVQDSRVLMMDRLRADWERAVDASGNPYKRDFESEGIETALGQLVRVTQGGARSFASPQVFEGLDAAVASLADELPGAHPLLRKWMKKLAKRAG